MWPDELSVRGRSEQVAVGIGDSGGGDRRSGAEATVTLVDARCDGVIAVPVAAIVGFGEEAPARFVHSLEGIAAGQV
jgi:hypothetical protein